MKRTKTRLIAAAALLALASGCARAWNAANRGSLERDVSSLLAVHGVTPTGLACRMEGATRDASCTLRSPAGDLRAFAAALALRAATGDDPSLVRLAARAPGRCAASGAPAFAVAGRPPSLKLTSGRAFEFLVLFHADATEEACLFLSYSYG